MRTSFEELIRLQDGDGASVMSRGPCDPIEVAVDAQDMLGAWLIERQRAVEAELVLKKTLRFLKRRIRSHRMLADSERREAQELIRIIQFRLAQQD